MRKSLYTAAVLGFVLSTYTFAQTTNATVGGIVADATEALIPGVTVTATNTGTGIVSTVLTNESGAYQFASLQPGTTRPVRSFQGSRLKLSPTFNWEERSKCA